MQWPTVWLFFNLKWYVFSYSPIFKCWFTFYHYMLCLTPASPQAFCSPRSLLHQQTGERTERVKARKTVQWDKDSFIGKAKAMHTEKANQGINSWLSRGRQMVHTFRAPSHIRLTWEDKHRHSKCPPFLLLHLTLCTKKYSFDLFS